MQDDQIPPQPSYTVRKAKAAGWDCIKQIKAWNGSILTEEITSNHLTYYQAHQMAFKLTREREDELRNLR